MLCRVLGGWCLVATTHQPCTDCSSTLSACLSLALCHNSLPLPAAPLQEYYEVGTSSGRLNRLLDGRVQSCVGSVRCVIPRPKSEATSTHNPHNTLPPIASTMDGASQPNTHHGTPRPPCCVGCKMRHEVERTTSFLSTNNTTFGSNKNIPYRLSLSCSYR